MLKRLYICFVVFILFFIVILSSYFDNSGDSFFPIHSGYSISSYYGYRTLGSSHFHNGIDIPAVVNTPVYPIFSGVISYIGFSSSYGHYIVITYTNGYKSLYGHMSGDYPFSVGSYVSSSDIVAYVGPKYLSDGSLNGFTTGPHLHFTLYKSNALIDPLSINFKYSY